MEIGTLLFVLVVAYLVFNGRGGCGCLLLLLALVGVITVL
jgi:hypothetical protein